MQRKVYQEIASLLVARKNCLENANNDWLDKHTERLESIAKDILPSGSGFDSGTKIDLNSSKENKIVLYTSFHHMNEHGMYTNWTHHKIIVKPSLAFNFDLSIGGRNQNDIKDYIAELFQDILAQEYQD